MTASDCTLLLNNRCRSLLHPTNGSVARSSNLRQPFNQAAKMGECSPSIASLTAEMLACNTLEKAQAYMQSLNEPISLHSYIAGSFKAWDADITSSVESFEPKTGRLFAKIPNTPEADVESAIHHAKLAFPAWSRTPRSQRSECLRRIANLIQENRELLAVWESIDQGKTLERARVEVDRAVSNFS